MKIKCGKCGGSGQYLNYGRCFRCNGTGELVEKGSKAPANKKAKYAEGDMLKHNQTGFIFVVNKVESKTYRMSKYTKDGNNLIDDITRLGRYIDNFPADKEYGYTKLN